MNKFYLVFLSVVMMIGVLMGCAQNEEKPNNEANQQELSADAETENVVAITITQNGEEQVAQEEITVEDGAILMDVLKQNFDIEETDGYITMIEGISVDEEAGKYWMYDVNGEMAPVGAHELVLNDDDEVHFYLQSME